MSTTFCKENMPIRKDEWIEIDKKIREALSPHGWRKAFHTLRELAPLGGIFLVILALGAIVVTLVIAVTNRREANAKFQQEMQDFKIDTGKRLEVVEGAIKRIESQLSAIRLEEIAALESKSFVKALPLLQKIIAKPLAAETPPDQRTLQQIASKLRVTPQTVPDYWPTVLQFIQFASAGIAPPGVPPPGYPAVLKVGPLALGVTINEEGQVIVLDGGEMENSTLVRCRIRFTEKPVVMRNVTFINCVFEMPVVTAPNDYLKKATKILLASNLQSVSIPNL